MYSSFLSGSWLAECAAFNTTPASWHFLYTLLLTLKFFSLSLSLSNIWHTIDNWFENLITLKLFAKYECWIYEAFIDTKHQAILMILTCISSQDHTPCIPSHIQLKTSSHGNHLHMTTSYKDLTPFLLCFS